MHEGGKYCTNLNTAENEKYKESAGKENPCLFSILPDIFITENNCLHWNLLG